MRDWILRVLVFVALGLVVAVSHAHVDCNDPAIVCLDDVGSYDSNSVGCIGCPETGEVLCSEGMELLEQIVNLNKSLGMIQSDAEAHTVHSVYKTPWQEMREQADALERADRDRKALRVAIAKAEKIIEGDCQ